MKNQWPFWIFLIIIGIAVAVALGYHRQAKDLSLSEIFSEEFDGEAVEYEYFSKDTQKSVEPVDTPVQETEKKPFLEKVLTKGKPKEEAAVAVAQQEKTVSSASDIKPKTSVVVPRYAVQVLSSKDRSQLTKELEKVKSSGLSDAFIAEVDLGEKGTWYRIYAKGFATFDDAKAGLPAVQAKYPQAFIIKL